MLFGLNSRQSRLELLFKSVLSLFGVAVLALGATLCREGKVGLDPYTAVNIGVSEKIGMSLGTYQLLANMVIILLVLLLDRKKIGIGTIMNMVGAGYLIDWFSAVYRQLFQYQPTLLTGIINGLSGLLVFTLGTSLYMSANVGVAPYDALAPIASKRLHIKYRFCRVVQDIGFMIAGWIVGGPIGLATVIISFFAGPLITFWNNHFSKGLVSSLVEFSRHPGGRNIGQGFDIARRYTVNLVRHSYQQTLLTQEQLSHYSDEELELRVKQTRRAVRDAKSVVKNTLIQYGMLKREEMRRKREENRDKKKIKKRS
ncbi:membrane protein [Sporolactobacillus sp. THM7-4]|nr:membrane protein [Sporolactobacillus sp. THM7-4]